VHEPTHVDAPRVIDICIYRYILDQTTFLYLPPHHHQQEHRLARFVGVGPAGYVWDRQGTWVGDVCIGPMLAVCSRSFEIYTINVSHTVQEWHLETQAVNSINHYGDNYRTNSTTAVWYYTAFQYSR